ncbi:MAG: hypothetical protein QOK11_656 [Pseudonocardiales bacterium]|nr:hypothetical protein [Pseudonocardiales bacterium]
MTDRLEIPFGPSSTAVEVLDGVDLSDKAAIVTGASSGIGVETARALARSGAAVTLAVRNVAAGEAVAAEIAADRAARTPLVKALDISEPASVAGFVEGWSGPCDILVANAGVMAPPETRNSHGWELQFATNHLGHFQLANGLHDRQWLSRGARVVVVSSVGHVNGEVQFADPNFEHTPYDPWLAYSQSKTANVLFAVEAARRWRSGGVAVNALNPGRIWSTSLSRHMETPPQSFDPSGATGVTEKTVEQGAATSVLLAGSPFVEGVTGKYFEDCQEAVPFAPGVRRGVAAYALDPDKAARLWSLSRDLLASAGYPVA